jgi:hypothetical protein
MKNTIFAIAVLATGLFATSCGNGASKQETSATDSTAVVTDSLATDSTAVEVDSASVK